MPPSPASPGSWVQLVNIPFLHPFPMFSSVCSAHCPHSTVSSLLMAQEIRESDSGHIDQAGFKINIYRIDFTLYKIILSCIIIVNYYAW